MNHPTYSGKKLKPYPIAATASEQTVENGRKGSRNYDYPPVLLTTKNYVEFLQGFISHISGRRPGGADAKYYLENEGTDPDISVEAEKAKEEYRSLESFRHMISSRVKRKDKTYNSHLELVQQANQELRRMRREFKKNLRASGLSEAPSELTRDSEEDEGSPIRGPFSSTLGIQSEDRFLEQDQLEYDEQLELIKTLKEQLDEAEEMLDEEISKEAQAQTNAKIAYQQMEVLSKESAERAKSLKQAKLDGIMELLDKTTFIPADQKAEILANRELYNAIQEARQSAYLFTVLQLITQGLQVEEPKSTWQ